MRNVPDPYLLLGVARGATAPQIKAAHRALAKRYHPDAPEGDRERFLLVQEAYLLLSDPVRRREWDARHAPGPVRAGDAGPVGGRARAADGRWTREEGTVRGRGTGERGRRGSGTGQARSSSSSGRRPAGGRAPGGTGPGGAGAGREGTRGPGAGGAGDGEYGEPHARGGAAGAAWTPNDRDPSTRRHTWSAAGVPWWEERPRQGHARGPAAAGDEVRGREPGPGPTRSARPPDGGPRAAPGAAPDAGPGAAPDAGPNAATGPTRGVSGSARPPDADVYSRSSGAAWSSAARRHFRRTETELPRRGAFRQQGTQYVTGAAARRAADEEEARPGRREPVDAPDEPSILRPRSPNGRPTRQAFEHEEDERPRPPAGDRQRPASTQPSGTPPPSGTQGAPPRAAGASSDGGPGSSRAPGPRTTSPALGIRRADARRASADAWPSVGERALLATVAWLPLAALLIVGGRVVGGCAGRETPACGSLVDPLILTAAVAGLLAFAAFPKLAYLGAVGTVGALLAVLPLVAVAAAVGIVGAPAPTLVAAAALVTSVAYVAAAAWASRDGPQPRPWRRLRGRL